MCPTKRPHQLWGRGARDAMRLPGFPRRSQRGGTVPPTTSSRPDGGQSRGAGRAQPHVGPSSWPAAPFGSRHSRPRRPAHGWWLSATSPAPQTGRPGPPAPGPPGEAAQPPPVSRKGLLAEWGLLSHLKALPPRPLPQPARDSFEGARTFHHCVRRVPPATSCWVPDFL